MRMSDWSSDVCSSDLLLGSIVFVVANYLLSDMNPEYWQFWLGLILVLVVLFARGGIMGTARGWLDSRRRAKTSAGDRKSVAGGRRGSVRVDHGGRRHINKKKTQINLHIAKISQ